MDDNELALFVCGKEFAKMLMEKDPEVEDALVITNILPEGQGIMVPKQEFIDYLYENHEVKNKE